VAKPQKTTVPLPSMAMPQGQWSPDNRSGVT